MNTLGNDTLSYFKQILTIPRPSGKEEKIRNHLIKRGTQFGYKHKVDNAGNLVIYVPATPDQQNSDTIILQAHMDMVCVAIDNSKHNFEEDPITISVNGDRIKANGTTLGADNGIGLAMILAASHIESHPDLELLFTVEEEIGLRGANKLDASMLSGKKIINLDTEDSGEVCISSAGGARVTINKTIVPEVSQYPQHIISITNMEGGHSGVDIHKNRGNAIHLLLDCVRKSIDESGFHDIEISCIQGGQAFNAIPGSCSITLGTKDNKYFDQIVAKYFNECITHYDAPHASIEFSDTIIGTRTHSHVFNDLIYKISDYILGVLKMSNKIEGLVETSVNLGLANTNKDTVSVSYLPRSSNTESLDHEIHTLQKLFSDSNETVVISDTYYGREQDPNDELVQIIKTIHKQVLGQDPTVVAVHAGLECGTIVSKLGPGAQAVSFGPTIIDPHSINERVSISTIKLTEKILFEFLSDPAKTL